MDSRAFLEREYIPMVLSLWAMHNKADDGNSVWIVRCIFASVSTSTLLVTSSYVLMNTSVDSSNKDTLPK